MGVDRYIGLPCRADHQPTAWPDQTPALALFRRLGQRLLESPPGVAPRIGMTGNTDQAGDCALEAGDRI